MTSPLRLRLDGQALVANWRWLKRQGGGAACGAAIKADAYGLGAVAAIDRLSRAGCQDFFVSIWDEVASLGMLPEGVSVSVLHGVQADEMEVATRSRARPVLNTPEQIGRWRTTGLPCDVMVDTGMNRLGISPAEALSGLLDELKVETLMSHLACADEDSPLSETQRAAFAELAGRTPARRMSLANSAGICLGPDYAFDLTRPGLALYGGVPRVQASGNIVQVVRPEARIVQRRRILAGQTVGYGATFRADKTCELAILNVGYADGYLRSFSGTGCAGGGRFPVIGRVSMDLVAIAIDAETSLREGDWVELDYDLSAASAGTGLSQYELLTGLGRRYLRIWE
jgi:alanine racemase